MAIARVGIQEPAPRDIPEQAPTVPYHRFTVDEYQWMGRTGILRPDDRVELLDGQIVDMAPIGPVHASIVDRLVEVLRDVLGKQVIVRAQSPVAIGASQPEPDLALLRRREDFYRHEHPTAADVLLVIEVADSSLLRDRDIKARLYLRSGVPEVWVVDVERRELLVFKDGESESYEVVKGGEVSPAAFPELKLQVAEILG
jgi:Uma2 family endonuclease